MLIVRNNASINALLQRKVGGILGDAVNEKNDFSDETLFSNNGIGCIYPYHKHSRYGKR